MKKLLAAWGRKHGFTPVVHEKYAEISDVMRVEDLSRWQLRQCDREDYPDWMPLRIKSDNRIKCFYINVNKDSSLHSHTLVLTIGSTITIDEWDGDRLISTKNAIVESKPSTKPTDEEFTMMATVAQVLGAAGKPFTIDGKIVKKV